LSSRNSKEQSQKREKKQTNKTKAESEEGEIIDPSIELKKATY